MNALVTTCKNLMNRSTLWWQKVQEKISMDFLSMFAVFVEKRESILTWKPTSRQTIWMESQSPATTARRFSGQEMQRPLTYHFFTGANNVRHDMFGTVFHFIFLEQGMVWRNIKPGITLCLVWTMNNYLPSKNTWSNKLSTIIAPKFLVWRHLEKD